MTIDCGRCRNRGAGCADCVVSVLRPPGAASHLDDAEIRALAVLAEAGLVGSSADAPPLVPELLRS